MWVFLACENIRFSPLFGAGAKSEEKRMFSHARVFFSTSRLWSANWWPLPGGVLQGILRGGVLPSSQNPDPTSDQNVIFHTRFQTKGEWARSFSLVQTWSLRLRLEQQRKKVCWNTFRIRIFLFLSYSLGTETINTFIRSRSSLENHTRFQTKMGKVYTPFKKAQKPYPKGRQILIWLI